MAQDKWKHEVPSEAIQCRQLIREGTYGRVFAGILLTSNTANVDSTDELRSEQHLDVLIKTVMGKQASSIYHKEGALQL